MSKKIILIIISALLVLTGIGYLFWSKTDTSDQEDSQRRQSKSNDSNNDKQKPSISVRQPKSGDSISTPFIISGEVRVFEGQFNYRVKQSNGEVLKEDTITIQNNTADEFSTYSVTVESMESPTQRNGFVEVYDLSARTGEETNLVSIPVSFENVESEQLSFNATTYESPNDNFEFKYPQDWYLNEAITDPSENAGVFGDIQSAWNVSTFNPKTTPDTGGIPNDSIKIDFEISIPDEGLDINDITQCDQSENTCETRTINGSQYTMVRNERGQVPSVLYVSMTNSMMYRASAIFGAEPDSEALENDIALFDEIVSTFVQK
jgi:hypothetical protein